MAHSEVERNSGASLRVTFYADGLPVDADGTVTVTVTGDDGTIIDSAATAAHVAPTGSGTYSYGLAPRANLDILTLVWTGTFSGIVQTVTTYADIVGGYYVTLADIRAMPNLSDTTKYPTAKLIEARRWFEERFERHTGRAFVSRYRRVTLWGGGTDRIIAPDHYISKLRSMSWGGLSLSADGLANTVVAADGTISRYWPYLSNATDDSWGRWGMRFPNRTRVELIYEYGMESTPADVVEAAQIAIRDKLTNDYSGRPMISIADGAGGTTRFAMPGPDRPFGIPDVDIVANDRRRPDWRSDVLTVGSVGIA